MYKHQSAPRQGISLHDCYINRITTEDQHITLHFPDGFWVANPKKMFRTSASIVTFTQAIVDDVFYNSNNISWETLCERINTGQWSIELINEYYRPRQGVLGGFLDDEVWHKRSFASIALWLAFEDVRFCWNEIREDRQW